MDHLENTTKHQKYKHLSLEDRVIIQIRLKDGWTAPRIAKAIGCCSNTVRNEIKRGSKPMYKNKKFWEPALINGRMPSKNVRNLDTGK